MVNLIVQFEVARTSTLVETVASGLCVSVLTIRSTPHNAANALHVIPFCEPELTYPIRSLTRANKMMTPRAAQFVRAHYNRFDARGGP